MTNNINTRITCLSVKFTLIFMLKIYFKYIYKNMTHHFFLTLFYTYTFLIHIYIYKLLYIDHKFAHFFKQFYQIQSK
jgi:hypothetical protein